MYLTLALYSIRKFAKAICIVYAVVISAFSVIDLIEVIRRTSALEITTLQLLGHTVLQIPFVIQETFVFIIFTSSIYTFLQMSKTNEYTIVKAAGISIWQFLYPFIMLTVIIGIFILTVINPIASNFLIKQQRILDKVISGNPQNPSAIFESGFWLVDDLPNRAQSLIINANTVIMNKNQTSLIKASAIEVDNNFQLIRTLEAEQMTLKNGHWDLENVTEYIAKRPKVHYNNVTIPTNVTNAKLESNFKRPDLVSVWELPYFMNTLKDTGHSAKLYVVYFYKLFIKPFLAVSLLFIAASFTLRPVRHTKLSRVITLCIVSGFIMYISVDITYTIASDLMASLLATLTFIACILSVGIVMVHTSRT